MKELRRLRLGQMGRKDQGGNLVGFSGQRFRWENLYNISFGWRSEWSEKELEYDYIDVVSQISNKRQSFL